MPRVAARPKDPVVVSCEVCGASIECFPSNVRKYCTKRCYGEAKKRLAPDFWTRIERGAPDDCWIWTGSVRGKQGKPGYGTIKFERGYDYAHRVAYRLTYGDIPQGQFVRHKCNNRLCCNPRHLGLGTHGDNMDDVVNTNRRGIGREALLAEIEHAKDRLARLERALEKLHD